MFLWHIHRFETILNSKATMTCDFECGTKMIDIGGKSLQDKFALQRHQEMEICFFFCKPHFDLIDWIKFVKISDQ